MTSEHSAQIGVCGGIMARNRILVLAGCAALLVSACAGDPQEINVEAQWNDAMRRLNMYGFYPAGEDVQVGDIFLYAPPEETRSVPRFSLIRLGSLPLSQPDRENFRALYDTPTMGVFDHLRAQQRLDRLRIAPYPRNEPSPPPAAPSAGGSLSQTLRAGGTEIITNITTPPPPAQRQTQAPAPRRTPEPRTHAILPYNDVSGEPRLRLAAIPSLVAGRLTTAQLGAAGVLGNIGARLGVGSASQTAVSIILEDLQELQIDAWRVQALMRNRLDETLDRLWAEDLLTQLQQLRPEMLQPACDGDVGRLRREGIRIEVMNRVMYAQSINYSFSREVDTAVRVALDLQGTLRGQSPQIPTVGPAASVPATAPAVGSASESTAAAGARLAALMAAVTGDTGQGARAGVSTSFGMGSFGALSLKSTFARPVAVAAGSRLSIEFHDLMRGSYAADQTLGRRNISYSVFRTLQALRHCRDNTPAFRYLDLARVMISEKADGVSRRAASSPENARLQSLPSEHAGLTVDTFIAQMGREIEDCREGRGGELCAPQQAVARRTRPSEIPDVPVLQLPIARTAPSGLRR